jgi:SAM-dependent methyltransferase
MLAAGDGAAAWFVRADVHALPMADRSCDVVIAGLMLPDVPNLQHVVHEWHRVLRPGGAIVCSSLHPIGAELGWTRTFDTPHGTATLPAHWHSLADYGRACAAAGLIVDASLEPGLDPEHGPSRPAARVPVALVLRLRRPR